MKKFQMEKVLRQQRILRRGGIAAIAAMIVLAGSSFSVHAGDEPTLNLPLDCVPDKTCWISKFVDLDPGPGVRDYTCHGRATDGHTGIDFAIRDLRAMAEGVAVVAAAPGKVVMAHDGVEDISARDVGPSMMSAGQCGNGVTISHGNGWATEYCHMRQGSIAVKLGDHVETGQKLGLVGMSGSAEYPHTHFMVQHLSTIVDPFVGIQGRPKPECGLGNAPLWNKATLTALASAPAEIFNYGFAAAEPKRLDVPLKVAGINFNEADVDKGLYRSTEIPASTTVLVFWTEIFGVEQGDVLHMKVTAPGGQTVVKLDAPAPSRHLRQFQYIAARRPPSGWPEGIYHGEISLTRTENGSSQSTAVSVDAHISSAIPDAPLKK
jgi:murein DD-endopeptidase MepM/ murein hydrolase activator NlpD